MTIGQMELATNPEAIAIAEADDMMIMVGVEINSMQHSGLIIVSYPVSRGISPLGEVFGGVLN